MNGVISSGHKGGRGRNVLLPSFLLFRLVSWKSREDMADVIMIQQFLVGRYPLPGNHKLRYKLGRGNYPVR
jgi:hypothetical protein